MTPAAPQEEVDAIAPEAGRAPLLAYAPPSTLAAADSATPMEPAAAHGPAEDPAGPDGQLAGSSARITVGEGDERVALWVGVRGESVRVEMRAHSAAYADTLSRQSHELAAGLADHGLVLGSLSADAQGDGDGAPRPDPHEERPDRPGHDGATDPQPDHPRPRGLRAIA